MTLVERRRMSRPLILEGAHAILDGGAYGDLTVDALARSLHMSKSTLYKYFPSKEDVVVALVERACVATDVAIATEARRGGDVAAVLTRLVEVASAHAERLPRAVLLQRSRLPEACQDRLEGSRMALMEALRAALSDAGGLEHPALVASVVVAACDAAVEVAARNEVPLARAGAVAEVRRIVLQGLSGPALRG